MARTIKILSIDGGGIRGIIPATILAEIEKRTGKPIYKLFDLIAGTSAGGIVALGLTCPNEHKEAKYSAVDIVKFFEDEGKNIFKRSTWHTINSLNGFLVAKYPEDSIERLLKRYFNKTYIAEALTNVLITAYEIERRDAFFFKSHKAKKMPTRNFLMRQAARATSAAPTYFIPTKIPTEDLSAYYALIDGGVFANNPAMCAYVEAKTLFPDAKNFMMVSLGTGVYTRPISYHDSAMWGLSQWARPILSVVFDGVSDTVHHQLKQLLPTIDNCGTQYFRFQTHLDKGDDELDNVSTENIRILKLIAEEIIRDEEDTLVQLTKQLI